MFQLYGRGSQYKPSPAVISYTSMRDNFGRNTPQYQIIQGLITELVKLEKSVQATVSSHYSFYYFIIILCIVIFILSQTVLEVRELLNKLIVLAKTEIEAFLYPPNPNPAPVPADAV